MSILEKTGRRSVCRLAYKDQFVRRARAFGNPPKRKEAGLKVRSASQTIRCMILRCNRYVVIKLGDQVVLITLRLHCRWIRQAVERSANNHQTQQTCRDLDSHRLVACPYTREEAVACSHFTDSVSGHVTFDWPRSNATPFPSMRETVWEIACNENEIDVQQIAIGSQSSESKICR